jgi:hypothetical protein
MFSQANGMTQGPQKDSQKQKENGTTASENSKYLKTALVFRNR